MESGNAKLIESSKKRIKSIIWDFEIKQWKSSCIMYPELKYYIKGVSEIRMIVWWSLARKHPHLMNKVSAVVAVIMGSQPKRLQCNFRHKLCRLCDLRIKDTPLHTLMSCTQHTEKRDHHLRNIVSSMPVAMANSFDNMTPEEKFTFMLSGLQCRSIIEEWKDIMVKICSFVFEIYTIRKQLYDQMDHQTPQSDRSISAAEVK